ncbi:MAG: SGNH/GDSL hydrolase family protein [Planctomycetota bacterium]|nr:SGNH/GDSL hydrolase family protein [Planctomycetota bacterium]
MKSLRRWLSIGFPMGFPMGITMGLLPLLMSCQTAETGRESAAIGSHPPARVLFVGNSFTFWRGGLARHLETLSAAMVPPLGYQAEQVVQGGASLKVMWNQTDAANQIASGNFDVVVLQEDLPETDVASFRNYSRKFVEAVRQAGARPILFMAWEYDRLDWISLDEIITAHRQVADQLQVEVAPVGLAWRNSKIQQPDLNMYARDAEHPSVAGMFLSLMVIEGTISGIDPVDRVPDALPIRGLQQLDGDALQFLRSIAGQSIRQWNLPPR